MFQLLSDHIQEDSLIFFEDIQTMIETPVNTLLEVGKNIIH